MVKPDFSCLWRIPVTVAALLAGLAAVWALLFPCLPLALIFATWCGLSIILLHSRPVSLNQAGLALLITFLTCTCLAVPAVKSLNHRIALLSKVYLKGHVLNVRQYTAIYGLNIMMGLAGVPLYPEASMETLLMTLPQPGGPRKFHSKALKKSALIRDRLTSFYRKLEKNTSHQPITETARLTWNDADVYHRLGSLEARAALAWNGAEMQTEAVYSNGGWKIYIMVTVDVRYPPRSLAVLCTRPRLAVEEGLFYSLQQKRWLHPYKAVWAWEESLP